MTKRDLRLLTGDALTVLKTLASESVHCCVTSPPYFGLRNYGMAKQLGLERTYPEYIARLVEVFREVRRVLRNDGTLWLVMGDSYATGGGKVGNCPGGGKQGERWAGYRGDHGKDPKASAIGPMTQANRLPQPMLKPKDLIGIPWRVAFALQADGWYLRSDIIWAKPNPMPESVRDRPTKAHEYVFLLAKSQRYFYDADAVKEPSNPASAGRYKYLFGSPAQLARPMNDTVVVGIRAPSASRNRRTVWTVTSHPYKGAHFATFPPKLIEPCILAGCPEGGVIRRETVLGRIDRSSSAVARASRPTLNI